LWSSPRAEQNEPEGMSSRLKAARLARCLDTKESP